MIVQHHLQFIQSDIKKSYPKREKQKLILVRKNQEKHCKAFAVWVCSVFRLSLAKIFCQSRISPKENSGASGGFLPKPLLRLRHPNSKKISRVFCEILSPKNSFRKTESALVPPPKLCEAVAVLIHSFNFRSKKVRAKCIITAPDNTFPIFGGGCLAALWCSPFRNRT